MEDLNERPRISVRLVIQNGVVVGLLASLLYSGFRYLGTDAIPACVITLSTVMAAVNQSIYDAKECERRIREHINRIDDLRHPNFR
jgi:hypothetical protein